MPSRDLKEAENGRKMGLDACEGCIIKHWDVVEMNLLSISMNVARERKKKRISLENNLE